MAVPRPKAIPSLGGGCVRYRPITAIRLIGPTAALIRDGLLDTGADDTVFPEETARLLGIDLEHTEARQMVLAARVTPIRCRYAPVQRTCLPCHGGMSCGWWRESRVRRNPKGSTARWLQVRITDVTTLWAFAPGQVRLPPQTLRLTTAGRVACSAQ